MPHHLLFEGADLAGKSWIMAQIYNYLEPKYKQSQTVLDGCHWFNCDVGIFGTEAGRKVIKEYLNIFKVLEEKNLLVEKFYLADKIYNRLNNGKEIDYSKTENELKTLNFKIVLITFPEEEKLIAKRIKDRLNLYPHYARIVREPSWYIKQQQEYLKEIKKTQLPYIIIETNILPDSKLAEKILSWLGETK